MLRKFRVPAYGSNFAGVEVNEPLIFDETCEEVPVPLECSTGPISTGCGGEPPVEGVDEPVQGR